MSGDLVEFSGVRNLVFQGGGVKGIAYLGALSELWDKDKDFMERIECIAGTSAGAITALILGLGYSRVEVETLFRKLDFGNFIDKEDQSFAKTAEKIYEDVVSSDHGGVDVDKVKGYLKQIFIDKEKPAFICRFCGDSDVTRVYDRLSSKMGIVSGEFFLRWIGERIKEKTGSADTTFAELDKLASGNKHFKKLTFIATNLASGRPEKLNSDTVPNWPLKYAVRASMAIPFVFFPVTEVPLKDGVTAKVCYVDGGLLMNYPIGIFDKGLRYMDTLGFKLADPSKIQQLRRSLPEKRDDRGECPEGFLGFCSGLVKTYFCFEENFHLYFSQDRQRTVYVSNDNVSTVDFGLTDEKKKALEQAGREGVKYYFEHQSQGAPTLFAPSISSAITTVVPGSVADGDGGQPASKKQRNG